MKKLAALDRRWIFLLIALSVAVPMFFPLNLPVEVSSPVKAFYDAVEEVPEGSVVLMSFDYGPGTKVECHPMAEAALYHFFRRHCRVVAIALWPEGALFAREAFTEIAAELNLKEGTDFVNLGYKNGGEVILRGMAEDFRSIYSQDMAGHPLDTLPLMKDVRGWNSIAMVCDWSMGKPGLLEFVRVVATQYGRPLIAGTTAVTTPEAYPFLNSGQVQGLLGGLRGAGEYEALLKRPGSATRGMDAQSAAHFAVAALIILANIIYFWEKSRRKK